MKVSKFPEKGDIVTANCKRQIERILENHGTAVIHKTKDRSMSNEVLECLYSDDRNIVVRVMDSRTFTKPMMLLRAEYEFFPASPELLAAMEIAQPEIRIEEEATHLTKEEAKTLFGEIGSKITNMLRGMSGK